ncbi:MAG: hypothetical protein ACREDR_19615 [Blastocatellia bacterium]
MIQSASPISILGLGGNVNIAEFVAYDPDDTLFPSDMWPELLEGTVANDPDALEVLAHMILRIKQEIESGPNGARQAVNTLMDLIHQMFPFSAAFRAARNLWILFLEGRITSDNEPEDVLNTAIEGGMKETMKRRARARGNARGRASRTKARSAADVRAPLHTLQGKKSRGKAGRRGSGR